MKPLRVSKDVQNLDKIKQMSEPEIDEQIRILANRINARIARVEKSTLASYLPNIANIKKWTKDNLKKGRLSNKISGSVIKKSIYLQRLEHYETYNITIRGAKEAREKVRQKAKERLGYKLTNEELDTIGKLMNIIYRDSEGVTSTVSELLSSNEAYMWITEHKTMSEEDAKQFMQDLKDFEDNSQLHNYTSQDIIDFIENYGNSHTDYYKINGIKIDRDTNQIVHNLTGELIDGYYYDATSENILGDDELIANVDDEGVTIPLNEFLRGKYGYN